MAWKGDTTNPAPNNVREPIDRSEKVIDSNRAEQVRRDKDSQRNFTINLYDIDETILDHVKNLQLQVEDAGKKVSVPAFFGSPEQWVSAQRDGYIRDKQGNLILPAIILKRMTSDSDPDLKFFNRYLSTSAIKLYSHKNQYTQFSLLSGQNAPVNEVFNLVMPSHVVLTYHFVIWTEYVEQMNDLVLKFQFNTNDYWGTKQGLRFRTKVESFGHTVEVKTGDDRLIKTEFDLVTHGYVLPDEIVKLDNHSSTANKRFTPKKIIMGAEVVGTDYNMAQLDKNREKWRNPNYPNLQADVPIPSPKIAVTDGVVDNSSVAGQIIQTLRSFTTSPSTETISNNATNNFNPYLRIVSPPPTPTTAGSEGYVAYDDNYFYIYSGGQWRSVAISNFS